MKRTSMLGLVLLALLAAACSGPSATSAQPPRAVVETSFSSTVGTIGVPASNYQVVVTTGGPCWVQVTHGTNAVFSGDVLPAGQTRTFSADNGKVSVQLGSVQVKVSVQIDGERVPSWRYTPTTSPFSLNFHSVS
jgi:Domain of unknown function (DUF4115)